MAQPSRLAQMQMRFQQKQQQDREKRLEQIAKPLVNQEAVVVDSGKLAATFGPGKVRQMFNERRQRGTGIDKSYPLQPITSQKASPNNSTSTTTRTTTVTSVRRAVGVKQTNGSTANNNNHIDLTTANRLNGNVGILNKQDGNHLDENNYSDLLDDEKFPDTSLNFDDELLNNSISTKLPNVGKLNLVNNNSVNMVNNSGAKSNGISSGVKLKPVVLKKSSSGDPPRTLNGNRKLPINRTAPSSVRASQESSPEKLGTVNTKSRNSSGNSSNGIRTSSVSTRTPSSTGNSPVKQQKKPMTTTSLTKLTPRPSNEGPLPGMSACSNCGRHFNEDRIEKHEKICQKTTSKKRKVFDITKHRVQGTEAEAYVRKSIKAPKVVVPKKAETPTKKSDWRKKHEEFIAAIRAAKEVQQHLARGGKLSDLPPPPPSENPDYVQCPHCSRRFNEAAATRHIPKCANMQHNKPKPALTKKKY